MQTNKPPTFYALGWIYYFADLRNKWHLVIDRLTVLFLKFLEYFHKMQVFVWWILELHIIKIVSSYIIWVSVKEASEHLLLSSGQTKPQWIIIYLSQLYDFILNEIPITLEHQRLETARTLWHAENQRTVVLRHGKDSRTERSFWLSSWLARSYQKGDLFSLSL